MGGWVGVTVSERAGALCACLLRIQLFSCDFRVCQPRETKEENFDVFLDLTQMTSREKRNLRAAVLE